LGNLKSDGFPFGHFTAFNRNLSQYADTPTECCGFTNVRIPPGRFWIAYVSTDCKIMAKSQDIYIPAPVLRLSKPKHCFWREPMSLRMFGVAAKCPSRGNLKICYRRDPGCKVESKNLQQIHGNNSFYTDVIIGHEFVDRPGEYFVVYNDSTMMEPIYSSPIQIKGPIITITDASRSSFRVQVIASLQRSSWDYIGLFDLAAPTTGNTYLPGAYAYATPPDLSSGITRQFDLDLRSVLPSDPGTYEVRYIIKGFNFHIRGPLFHVDGKDNVSPGLP